MNLPDSILRQIYGKLTRAVKPIRVFFPLLFIGNFYLKISVIYMRVVLATPLLITNVYYLYFP